MLLRILKTLEGQGFVYYEQLAKDAQIHTKTIAMYCERLAEDFDITVDFSYCKLNEKLTAWWRADGQAEKLLSITDSSRGSARNILESIGFESNVSLRAFFLLWASFLGCWFQSFESNLSSHTRAFRRIVNLGIFYLNW